MKKVLIYLTVIGIILFLFINSSLALITGDKDYMYREDYHSIKFKNLNSKNLNELFLGINGTVIEIEVETSIFTKSYRFNTSMIDNVEQKLEEKVTKDLIDLGKREQATTYQVQGYKITRMDILCTKEELNLIKTRTETE